jgi:hypothetical protein
MTDLVLSWRQNFDLSWRLKDCKHWRWMPGMLAWYDDDNVIHRVTRVSQSGRPFGCLPDKDVRVLELGADSLPDLNDPATLGCLLALIRELRHDPTLHAHPYAHGWKWSGNYRHGRAIYDSEAEALVAALEAAP